MNHKFTRYGLLGTILVFLIIFGCRQDDFYNTPTKEGNGQGLKINRITGKEAKRVADQFKNDISAGFLVNSETGMTSKTTGGTGTIKYDEIIEVIDTLGNTNYTFLIEGHPEQDERSFFNLIINVKEGEQNVFLVKHHMDEDFAYSYYLGNTSLENFTGNMIIQNIGSENPCIDEVISYPIDNGTGTGIGGGGSGGGGGSPGGNGSTNNNPPALLEDLNADPCPDVICDSEDQVKKDCQCITYVSISPRYFKIGYDLVVENIITYDPCDDLSGGNIGTIGVLDDDRQRKKECKKIQKVLDENPGFKQELLNLVQNASTATKETMITLHSDGSTNTYQGEGGIVEPTFDPNSKYVAMGHNHDMEGPDGNGTYSIYSSGDLSFVAAVDILNSKIDMNKFVSFLVTSQGTQYAFTINSNSKFRTFFEYLNAGKENITPEERLAYYEKAKLRQDVLDKYYNERNPHPTYPLIKETNTDPEMDLRHFLSFINEADLGISVFEIDESFNIFTEVKKSTTNPTQLDRNLCN